MTNIETIISEATALRDAGDYKAAEAVFRSAIASGLNHKNAYIGLATMLEAQEKYADACEALEHANGKFPNSAAILFGYGKLLYRMNKYREAIPVLLRVMQLVPQGAAAYEFLALCYVHCGDIKRAAATVEAGLTVNPKSLTLIQLVAFVATKTGNFARALAYYDKLAALTPQTYLTPKPDPATSFANTFSRQSPSPRYGELSKQYELIHIETARKNKDTFAGIETFMRVVPVAQRWLSQFKLTSMLDYGGGQGMQYQLENLKDVSGERFANIAAYLGVDTVDVYDAGRPDTERFLAQKYDAVICTDVLEHCDKQDLPWIVRELFGSARRAVFATIATYPAVKHLPNGENAHCTLESSDWWSALFVDAARDFPGINYGYLVVMDKGFDTVEAYQGGPDIRMVPANEDGGP